MRSIERVMIATFVYFMSLVVNAIMNAILILDFWDFRHLEFKELQSAHYVQNDRDIDRAYLCTFHEQDVKIVLDL